MAFQSGSEPSIAGDFNITTITEVADVGIVAVAIGDFFNYRIS